MSENEKSKKTLGSPAEQTTHPLGSPLISYSIDLIEFRGKLNLTNFTVRSIQSADVSGSASLEYARDAILFALEGSEEDTAIESHILSEIQTASNLVVYAWGCKSCGEWWYRKTVNGHTYCPRCR
ncbi:hypothetical protein AVI51_15475 (plasmid) [Piscirickettsia salmonis]|uniref:Uncharacterized protein n=1 Tax=Piscirickettsia salmonis TaxID=1238 RepID=A0A9Q5VA18_PISSA|nr:hypothetical protein [Piscirickettsia salmonis]APS46066.1 hypothetical protein AVI48_16765 [Piscirickettsia salmonis]APS49173.1 hypothetical protein AVI49_16100 [Piscirickettsia salmonis]APS52370.1 hypothetical protein AVI50_16035 [Piscirickettsia salmonis]APS55522.1 hypothetical protein AVI51_15475 [Piscirickettsia salmonis]APS58959.1 hypothetical protein AVI52_17170 [Piscirickettsia salmonis]